METARLKLKQLTATDAEFIFNLVNSSEWIKYIGERNIKTIEDAQTYIHKIIDNPNITYWVIYNQQIPVGIISLVKREFLQHEDIGFALLPEFMGNGYAFEATKLVLDSLAQSKTHSKIQAITIKENQKSIQLLEKLGFKFEVEIKNDKETLLQFSMTLNS